MPTATSIAPGATYILHDYAIIQIVAVAGTRLRYRVRSRARPWRPARVIERSASVTWAAQRIRAEIDGGFFPDLVASSAHQFRHGAEEASALRRHLDQRALHRPFAAAR